MYMSSSVNELPIPSEESSRILFLKKTILNFDHLIFDDILGYNDITKLFNISLSSEKPVHILVVGSPASAIISFMLECIKLEHFYFMLCSDSPTVEVCLNAFKQLLYDYSNSCLMLLFSTVLLLLLYSTQAYHLMTFKVSFLIIDNGSTG